MTKISKTFVRIGIFTAAIAIQISVYANYSHAILSDLIIIDSTIIKYLNQTYGFLVGQEYTVNRIKSELPEMANQVLHAQIKFNSSFGSASKNLEKTLAEVYGARWAEVKNEANDETNRVLSTSNLTRDAAIHFIDLVNNRAKGQIETPFLQVLLMCHPDFQKNPIQEVRRDFKQTFRTQKHPKSKGLDIQVEYPSSWSCEEGKRPNVIQLFRSNYGMGLSSALIMTRDIAAEAGGDISPHELSELNTIDGANRIASHLFSKKNLVKMVKNMGLGNMRKIQTKRLTIDRWPGAMIDVIGEGQRLDIELTTYYRQYLAIYKRYLIFLQCFITKSPSDDETIFKERIDRYLPLFHWMANSLVIQSQYYTDRHK